MLIIYVFLSLLLSIKTRIYETMNEIYLNLSKSIHKIPLQFVINGTNDYSYNFTSKDIFYYFNLTNISDVNKEINISNQDIKIIFDLNIYDYNNRIFNFYENELKYQETISIDILFKKLRFYELYDDFSFDFQYEIDDFEKDVIINYENIDKLNFFNYLFFEDRNVLYDNKTLNDMIKINVMNNFQEQIKKYLVYFPECDSLAYFKSIIYYFKDQLFSINLRIIYQQVDTRMTIIDCKVSEFKYQEIVKDNRTIIFKNINVTAYFLISFENPDDYDDQRTVEETKSFLIDSISIDENKQITYGNPLSDRGYELQSLEVIVNMTINTLENKSNK